MPFLRPAKSGPERPKSARKEGATTRGLAVVARPDTIPSRITRGASAGLAASRAPSPARLGAVGARLPSSATKAAHAPASRAPPRVGRPVGDRARRIGPVIGPRVSRQVGRTATPAEEVGRTAPPAFGTAGGARRPSPGPVISVAPRGLAGTQGPSTATLPVIVGTHLASGGRGPRARCFSSKEARPRAFAVITTAAAIAKAGQAPSAELH